MPWRKRLAVAAAVVAGLALLAASAALAARGLPVAGGLLAVAVLAAATVALELLWVRFDLATGSLRRGRRDRPAVALTFDDGPGDDTPAVLDALDRAGVKATFFVLGRHAAARPDLVREVARRGHLVALHGHGHRKLHLAGPAALAAEIDGGRAAIEAAGVEPAPFFRAPHGWKSPLLGRALRARGLRLVGWTRGVWDTERPGAAAIAARATDRLRAGEILLLHDGCATPGIDPRRDQTAEAVAEIARRARAQGLELVRLDALEPAPRVVTGELIARTVGLVLLLALVVYAAKRLDPREIADAFRDASPGALLLATAVNLGALWAQSLRWLALVHPAAPRARPWDAFYATVTGFAVGLVMPARASDVARAHLLSRRSGASMAAIAGTLVLDHIMSGASLIAFLGLFALFAPLPDWARHAAHASLLAAVVAGAAVFVLRPRPGVAPATRGLRGLVGRARHGLSAASKPRALVLSAAAACVGWCGEVAIGMATLHAFGLPVSVQLGVLLMLATTISAAASVSPGNAGAFELAVVLALAPVGVPSEKALAFAIGYHAVHLVPVALMGSVFAVQAGNRGVLVADAPAEGERAQP
jgi:peptidoglycan/xylan/chitin deacetylase (PgdA/CDA1 family)/uncharacterized membrane protein YbhN (UPF0104 family)